MSTKSGRFLACGTVYTVRRHNKSDGTNRQGYRGAGSDALARRLDVGLTESKIAKTDPKCTGGDGVET